MNPLRTLLEKGQSVWFDNLSRQMLQSGELKRMITEDGLRGVTSNPTIFEKAIAGSHDYDSAIAKHIQQNPNQTLRELFFTLAIEDIQAAADLMLPVYREADGHDGLVSLEVSPDLAYDTAGTIAEAKKLWKRVNRPNLMIKVPATKEGVPAVEQLIAEGVNVNVTLLFSVERYREVADAYIRGLNARHKKGADLQHVASVASFFVSRVDGAIDKQLEELAQGKAGEKAEKLFGKIAIANAKLAYKAYDDLFGTEKFKPLNKAGARVQRLLWASTGTKSATYSDVLYIEELIGKDTVTTVPPSTYAAFKHHGKVKVTLDKGRDEAAKQINALKEMGIDLGTVTTKLEDEGVKSFTKSFETLLEAIDRKSSQIAEKNATVV